MLHDNVEREQEMLATEVIEQSACSGDRLSTITGLRFCHTLHYPLCDKPVPAFPMTASWSIERSDAHARYEFELRAERQRQRDIDGQWRRSTVGRLYFDTPGSIIDRRIVAEVAAHEANSSFVANMETPWKNVNVKAAAYDADNKVGVAAEVMIDRESAVELKALLHSRQTQDGTFQ